MSFNDNGPDIDLPTSLVNTSDSNQMDPEYFPAPVQETETGNDQSSQQVATYFCMAACKRRFILCIINFVRVKRYISIC